MKSVADGTKFEGFSLTNALKDVIATTTIAKKNDG